MQILLELKRIPNLIKESSKEVKRVTSLCGCALLSALNTVVGQFTIVVSSFLEISFTSVVAGISGFYYGPVLSGIAGGIVDILKFLIHPTGPFFLGFTLNEIILGFIYGTFFYKKEITLKRVIVARICVTFVVNLIMTSLWLSMLYGKTFWAYMGIRFAKNILMLPVDIALLYTVLKIADKNPAIKKR